MFVKATGRSQAPSKANAVRSAGAGGPVFRIDLGEAPSRARALEAPTAAGHIGALVSLQSVDDVGERRQRTIDDSHKLLDLLDELKVGLLGGRLAEASIVRLRNAVEGYDATSDDPRLQELVKAIDVRAQVELAKLAKRGH